MSLSSQFAHGQQAVTNAVLPLNGGVATQCSNGFKLTNLSTSTASLFYGGSAVATSGGAQVGGDELPAGQSVIIPIQNMASVYVIAAANGTTTCSYFGVN